MGDDFYEFSISKRDFWITYWAVALMVGLLVLSIWGFFALAPYLVTWLA